MLLQRAGGGWWWWGRCHGEDKLLSPGVSWLRGVRWRGRGREDFVPAFAELVARNPGVSIDIQFVEDVVDVLGVVVREGVLGLGAVGPPP